MFLLFIIEKYIVLQGIATLKINNPKIYLFLLIIIIAHAKKKVNLFLKISQKNYIISIYHIYNINY